MDVPAPFRLPEVTVAAEWTDYNHHLTESAYLLIMGESSDAFFRFFGIDDAYRAAGHSLYTVETQLHILHEMYGATGSLIATAEQMLLHVDTRAGQAAPFPSHIAELLGEIRAAHAAVLPVPEYVGRSIRIPPGPVSEA